MATREERFTQWGRPEGVAAGTHRRQGVPPDVPSRLGRERHRPSWRWQAKKSAALRVVGHWHSVDSPGVDLRFLAHCWGSESVQLFAIGGG